jgi:hypothetical protein
MVHAEHATEQVEFSRGERNNFRERNLLAPQETRAALPTCANPTGLGAASETGAGAGDERRTARGPLRPRSDGPHGGAWPVGAYRDRALARENPARPGGLCQAQGMDDKTILNRISELVEEEQRLRADAQARESDTEGERDRLRELEESLDQCWDLLRRRRAARQAHGDPDAQGVRPTPEVERYLQ